MMTTFLLIILSTSLICTSSSLRIEHTYYSLETAEFVDQSQSIIQLNKCKVECLQMKQYFPFSFRYHRLIVRQTDGMVKYFVGHCQVKLLNNDYQGWQKLKNYIDSSNLFGENDVLNNGEKKIWQNFNGSCENNHLQLTEAAIKSLQLTRNHSNFYYYDNGEFKNIEPFDDIGSMFADINKLQA